MKKIYVLLTFLLSLSVAITQAQSFTVIENMAGITTGKYPQGNLTQAGKRLYGMASHGGSVGYGCIFTIDTNGNGLRILHSFGSIPNDAFEPEASLIISGKTLYGMSPAGGSPGSGVVFSVDTDGTNYTNLWGFGSGKDGNDPRGNLTLVGNTLYGECEQGGLDGYGTIFSISTTGTNYKVLINCNDTTNGMGPIGSLTAQGKYLYGTTYYGGTINAGCIFRIDTTGKNDTILHSFDNTNGEYPWGAVLIVGNTIFGTCEFGGSGSSGVIYSMKTNGTDFKVIYNGGGYAGRFIGDLTISNGVLYDMSEVGGSSGNGTIFSIDTNGSSFKVVVNFSGSTGSYLGSAPQGSLTKDGNTFFGMTYLGGSMDSGAIFKLSPAPTAVNNIKPVSGSTIVYPNPSHGTFTLEFMSLQLREKNTLEIFDLLGNKVLSENLPVGQVFNTIDMQSSSQGVYFYRVISESGEIVGEGKLIKEQ